MNTNTGQTPTLYTTAAGVPGPPQYSTQQPNYGPDQKYENQQQPQQQQQQQPQQPQQPFGGQQFGGTVPPPAASQQPQQQFQQMYPGQPGMGQGYYPPVMVVQQPVPAPVLYAQQPMYVQQFPMPMGIGGLSTAPGVADCPRCGKRGLTNINLIVGSRTHVWAFLFCIFLGLGCIPYLMDSLKDVEHHCSSCGTLLMTYRR